MTPNRAEHLTKACVKAAMDAASKKVLLLAYADVVDLDESLTPAERLYVKRSMRATLVELAKQLDVSHSGSRNDTPTVKGLDN